MHTFTHDELMKMIHPDKVHGGIYSDPDLFELEMEQLFGRAWLLPVHESQVRKPGDFFRTEMARQPVIVSVRVG